MIWHNAEYGEVLKELKVDANNGLANGVAEERLDSYGKNIVTAEKVPSLLKRIKAQLNNKFVYILSVISIISFVLSLIYKQEDIISPLLIIAVVIFNSLVTAILLHRSDKAIYALKNAVNPNTTVLRDSIEKSIPSSYLVPGDIVLLKAGDYIPADCRLIEASNFRVSETTLNGINIPVDKNADTVLEAITPTEQRINMIYSGCSVVSGNATAVVVETGANTELGHTTILTKQDGIDEIPIKTALKQTEKISNIIILAVCMIIFVLELGLNWGSGVPFASMTAKTLMNAIALAVAAIPEGLPAIFTVAIALSIQRIISEEIIIKKVSALQTLGKTTVICSDKTGIITKKHMLLERIYSKNVLTEVFEDTVLDDANNFLLQLSVACSTLNNDATEKSIEVACNKYSNITKEEIGNLFPRMGVIPFDAERKCMTSINMISGKPVAIVKGAPEMMAEKFKDISAKEILDANNQMANDALRVVCIGIKSLSEVPAIPTADEIENNLVFAGLLGFSAPPKDDTIESIIDSNAAGIKTIMITGDNILTAKAIAKRIGILSDDSEAINGAELAKLSDDELRKSIKNYSVYARITPEDKLRIIKAWQSTGETVTVTGDSLSDADALSIADIGCALGENGTDVSKGNADVIIKNSSLNSVVYAIKESRGLFANIQKAVGYLISCNVAEIAVYLIGLIIFGSAPLLAIQYLLINLLTDTAPVISLSLEKAENDVMNRKPLALVGKIFNLSNIRSIAFTSIFISTTTIISALIGNILSFKSGMTDIGVTMAFITMALSQIFHLFNVRTASSIFSQRFSFKSFLTISSLILMFVVFFLVLTPAGLPFGLALLSIKELIIAIALALLIIPFSEMLKLINRIKD